MTGGLIASQAGHAFLHSYLKSPPDISDAYISDGGGIAVVLACPDEATIWQLYKQLTEERITCHLWMEEDLDRCPTALGVGPVERNKVKSILGGLKLMP